MQYLQRFSFPKLVAKLFYFLLGVLWFSQVQANVDIARLAGLGSCSSCHSGNVTPTKETLNSIGLKYLGCQLNQGCYNQLTAAVRALQNFPTGSTQQQSGNTPPPYVAPTSVPNQAAVSRIPSGAPKGPYQNQCRNVTVSSTGQNLYANCPNKNNLIIYSKLTNFSDCASEVAVDAEGYLVCNMRNGNANPRLRAIDVKNESWAKITEMKVNVEHNAGIRQWGDLDMGKLITFPIGASTPCMVAMSYKLNDIVSNIKFDSCVRHKLIIEGKSARFE